MCPLQFDIHSKSTPQMPGSKEDGKMVAPKGALGAETCFETTYEWVCTCATFGSFLHHCI